MSACPSFWLFIVRHLRWLKMLSNSNLRKKKFKVGLFNSLETLVSHPKGLIVGKYEQHLYSWRSGRDFASKIERFFLVGFCNRVIV